MGNTQTGSLEQVEGGDVDVSKVKMREKGKKRPRSHSGGSTSSRSSGSKIISTFLGLGDARPDQIRKNIFVVAIDIGTSFSGYAISVLDDYNNNPLKIQTFHWMSKFDGHATNKMPSDLLLRPDGSIHSFGYDAEYNYANLAQGEHHLWYYFKSFKMILYETPKLNRFSVVKDITGKEISALHVFCYAIFNLKNDLLSKLQQQIDNVDEDDIHYVITVPAIWSDKAKQLMREAAEKAGIEGSRLSLALEPEAAAIYCQHVPTERRTCIGFPTLTSAKDIDSKYLVVDLGGGTVDITGFHSSHDGVLRELMSARGGDWGSNSVNESFVNYFGNVFTQSVLDKLRMENPDEYASLLSSFERKKIVFNPEQDDKVTLPFPSALRAIIKDKFGSDAEMYLKDSPFSGEIRLIHDKMVITREVFSSFYNKTIDGLIRNLTCLLSRNKYGIETILLVGGFANSSVLQQAIHSNFSNFRVVIPHEAHIAVLKGAILYGRNPYTVKARIIRKTYGVKSVNNFNPNIHPREKRIVLNGELVIGNIFDTHIKANQIAEAGQKFAREIYHPVIDNQTSMIIEIFTSDGEPPMFVTDRNSLYLGKLVIELPSFRRSFMTSTNSRKIQVRFKFDGTEIEVEAMVPKTKELVHAKFDFLG